MFRLIIKKNRSKNFTKALDCALTLGGTYDGKQIEIIVNEDLHIYEFIFPLLKFNVTNWVGTKAYFNGKRVHPYRFMLQKHLSIKIALNQIKNQLDKSPGISNQYEYYKRTGNRFFFRNEDFSFDVELKGKE